MVSRGPANRHQSPKPTSPEPNHNFIPAAAVCQPHHWCRTVTGTAKHGDCRDFGEVGSGSVTRSEDQDVDCAVDAGRSGKSSVSRHEWAREALGKSNVGGVVWGHVRTKLVGSDHQRAGRKAGDRK